MSTILEQYAEDLAALPLPTQKQREAFARHVSVAHSWYKHLPLTPPGVRFFFCLDRFSGCDEYRTEIDSDQRVVPAPIVESARGAASYPTVVYRERFGHLSYSWIEPPLVRIPKEELVRVRGEQIVSRRTSTVPLPPEAAHAGLVEVTGVIHPFSARIPALWLLERDRRGGTGLSWPEESGGPATLEKIFARVEQIAASGHDRAGTDPELDEILAPERERQLRQIVSAIDRFCDCVSNRT